MPCNVCHSWSFKQIIDPEFQSQQGQTNRGQSATDTDICSWPIFQPIPIYLDRHIGHQYRYRSFPSADTDIADIYLSIQPITDTDMPILISSLSIPIYRYGPNIKANRYISLTLKAREVKTLPGIRLFLGLLLKIVLVTQGIPHSIKKIYLLFSITL